MLALSNISKIPYVLFFNIYVLFMKYHFDYLLESLNSNKYSFDNKNKSEQLSNNI